MNSTISDKSFSTSPQGHRRKAHSPVRDRCIQFLDILREYGYTLKIPLEKAKELFQQEMNIMDQKSLAAYFGTHQHRVKQRMERFAQYGSGHSALKRIELSYEVQARKGYFEILNLANFELKGKTWFMTFNCEGLVPQLGSHTDEGSECSIDSFSLSVGGGGIEAAESKSGDGIAEFNVVTRKKQQTHTLLDQREKLSLEKIDTSGSTEGAK